MARMTVKQRKAEATEYARRLAHAMHRSRVESGRVSWYVHAYPLYTGHIEPVLGQEKALATVRGFVEALEGVRS